jgi:aspartate aminotransferase
MNNISSTLKAKIILEEYKNNNKTIYNYGLGENPIKQPEYYIDMMKKYAGKKHYTNCSGIPELNKTLKDMYDTYNTKYEVLVGNGLKELLFIIQMAFEGKIIHITPSWVSYKEHIQILNKEDSLIEFETSVNENFKINLNKFESLLESIKTENKIVLFNNPNNPTGIAYNNVEIEQFANLLKKYNCYVFADEIYLNLCYSQNVKSISHFIPELTIQGSSVSKDLGCGGYRLGWVAFPENLNSLYNKCAEFSSNIYSCASVPTQYATNDMLLNKELHKHFYIESSKVYNIISSKICELLDTTKLNFVKPNAAWYVLINFDAYKKELNKLDIYTGTELSTYLLEKLSILTVAGDPFNIKGLNLRLSFVDFKYTINQKEEPDISNMIEGVSVLSNFLKLLK